jgi:hypothetical protein
LTLEKPRIGHLRFCAYRERRQHSAGLGEKCTFLNDVRQAAPLHPLAPVKTLRVAMKNISTMSVFAGQARITDCLLA